MEIEIDYTKSAHENAGDLYDKGKRILQKREGAKKAIKDLQKSLEEAEQKAKRKSETRIISLKREWYESFRWFNTSEGLIAIGGRDAHQNEALNSKHFTNSDLFFHADIFGAAVFILKDGIKAGALSKEEVAMFAGCYSSAWKGGLRNIDIYCMRREQVSKSTSKGSLGTGSFLLKGEREWYRSVPLGLVFFMKDGRLNASPRLTMERLGAQVEYVEVVQGEEKKSDAAKRISRILGCNDIDEIMRQLPPEGGFGVSEKKAIKADDRGQHKA